MTLQVNILKTLMQVARFEPFTAVEDSSRGLLGCDAV